jgi:hypothetical protein
MPKIMKYIKDHNLTIKKIDITDNYYRIRQHNPIKGKKYFIKNIKKYVKYIYVL